MHKGFCLPKSVPTLVSGKEEDSFRFIPVLTLCIFEISMYEERKRKLKRTKALSLSPASEPFY